MGAEADPGGETRQCRGDGRIAQNQQARRCQHRLDEHVHDAAARAAGAEVHDPGELRAGVLGADADELCAARLEHRTCRLDDGRAAAVAADPSVQGAVGLDERLGPGPAGRRRFRAHHRDEGVRPAGRAQPLGEIENGVAV